MNFDPGRRPLGTATAPSLKGAFLAVSGVWLTLWLGSQLAPRLPIGMGTLEPGTALAVIAGVGALLLGMVARRAVMRWATSLAFAVALLGSLLLATALGTVVLQGAPPEEYARRYHPVLARALLGLGLDDVFHTFWFRGLLGVLALSLVLVFVKNRAWRPAMWGHGLSHLGVVVILAGGLIGNVFGFRGFIDLHEGEVASQAAGTTARGKPTGRQQDLGFVLKLERFAIERYTPDYRIYLYDVSGKEARVTQSLDLDRARDWQRIAADGTELRVARVYPDFYQATELRAVADGTGKPALRLVPGPGTAQVMTLIAGVAGRDAVDLTTPAARVQFCWQPPTDAELARRARARSELHTVSFRKDPSAAAETIPVEPGHVYDLGAGEYRLKVLSYLPDFVYDIDARQPTSRSQTPNNPAMQVVLSHEDPSAASPQWLFDRLPDYGKEHGKGASGVELIYHHEPAFAPAPRELVLVGGKRELWELVHGEVTQRLPLPGERGTVPGCEDLSFELYASAEEVEVPATRSEQWSNPVIEAEFRLGDRSITRLLGARSPEPLHLPDGKTVLRFAPKADDIKAYRSSLSVLAGDATVLTKTIAVNDPLVYRGYHFYQSNYRQEDPTYSGILVVKDPGLPLVFAGFAMIGVGAIFVYYVRPRLLSRNHRHA